MEEKKEILNEENYEKGKKKIKNIALIVLIVGVLLGGGLIVTGIIKTNNANKVNEQITQQVEESNSNRTKTEVQADIDSLQEQMDTLESEISDLKIEQNKIFTDDMGFSDRYYEKEKEIETKEKELSKLKSQMSKYEDELWKIQSGYNDTKTEFEKVRNTISTSKYVPLYMIGGFIIVASCMISLAIYMISKRREILAFTTQQVMPVAQEGIEKMAPTIGKVGAEVAKGISKGIKEGQKEAEDNKE